MKAEDWVTIIRVTDKLHHGDSSPARWSEPAQSVSRLIGGTFLNGPTEYISNKLPIRLRPSGPDYLEIDELYGSYDPRNRAIEIYQKRIEQDHRIFKCSREELTYLVRIHEYAHAAVHLGVRQRAVESLLLPIAGDERTDWKRILRQRNRSFRRIPTGVHELLAQSVTWSIVSTEAVLADAFRAFEERQPPEYQVPEEVKNGSPSADWPLIIEAVRGDDGLVVPRKSSLRRAVEKFIASAAG